MSSVTLLPWFAPRLSPGICRVLSSIGHESTLTRGETIGTSAFFKRLVFVRSGLLAQAAFIPGTNMPFMLTLSAPSSFGYLTASIDVPDNLPRRYRAACRCEVLTVVPEIFLRVTEIEPAWNEEIASYAVRRAFCERLGLMVCQAAAPADRLGVFLLALAKSCGTANIGEMSTKSFVRLPSVPSRRCAATLLNCPLESIDAALASWGRGGRIRREGAVLSVKAELLQKYEAWLQPFLQMQPGREAAGRSRPTFDVSELF